MFGDYILEVVDGVERLSLSNSGEWSDVSSGKLERGEGFYFDLRWVNECSRWNECK